MFHLISPMPIDSCEIDKLKTSGFQKHFSWRSQKKIIIFFIFFLICLTCVFSHTSNKIAGKKNLIKTNNANPLTTPSPTPLLLPFLPPPPNKSSSWSTSQKFGKKNK